MTNLQRKYSNSIAPYLEQMGNKQQTAKTQRRNFLNMFQLNYRVYSSTIHKTFGCIDIFANKSTGVRDVFVKTLSIPDPNIESVIKKFQRRVLNPHCNILAVYQICKDMKGTCGLDDELRLYCEYIETDLKREINYRRKTKKYFTQTQLWKILYGLVSALKHLHIAQEFHGEMTVSDVLIHRRFNIIKLIDKALTIGQNLNLKMSAQNTGKILKNRSILFAPSIMRCLENKKTQMNAYDPFKADIFSTGMVLLEAATLEDSCALYDYDNFTIKTGEINKRLKNMGAKYSQQLVKCLQEILSQFDDPRPSAKELLEKFPEQRIKTSIQSSLEQPLLSEPNANR